MSAGAKKQENFVDKPHVLVVDDDVRICDLVSRYLSEQDFVVLSAHNADEARRLLERFSFDVLVVDVMMPGETGLEFVKGLREGSDLPVLLLTALGEVENRIDGLEAGADDYLAKPFEPRELVLRLNAILRRVAKENFDDVASFQVGRWVFDPEQNLLSDGDVIEKLTDMEANLLKVMGQRSGQVLSRDDLAELCGIAAGERTIDVQVTRLRRKIEEDTKAPRYLQTVRGKGYILRVGD